MTVKSLRGVKKNTKKKKKENGEPGTVRISGMHFYADIYFHHIRIYDAYIEWWLAGCIAIAICGSTNNNKYFYRN